MKLSGARIQILLAKSPCIQRMIVAALFIGTAQAYAQTSAGQPMAQKHEPATTEKYLNVIGVADNKELRSCLPVKVIAPAADFVRESPVEQDQEELENNDYKKPYWQRITGF